MNDELSYSWKRGGDEQEKRLQRVTIPLSISTIKERLASGRRPRLDQLAGRSNLNTKVRNEISRPNAL